MSSISFYDWGEPDWKATEIAGKYQEWQSYKEPAMNNWEEIEAYLYATDTTSLNDAFDHTTHIPILAEIKEDLEAILYSTILPHDDWLGWRPYDLGAATLEKRDKALAYINNRNNLNGFRHTMRNLIHDYIVYGNAFVMSHHVNENKIDDNGNMVAGYFGPKPKRISPYDISFDPTVEDFDKSPKIVRVMMSMGEFFQHAEENGWNKDAVQQVLDRRGTGRNTSFEEQHKNQQYTPEGFNSIEAYMQSGQVEVLWFYGDIWDDHDQALYKGRCIAVVDRFNVLFDREQLTTRIHKAGWGLRPDNLWAQSPLAKVVGMNYQINHRENAKSTAMDKFIYPDRILAGDVEEVYDDETGQVRYLANEGGTVTDITPDSSVLSFDSHIDRLTFQARAAARLPQQLAGFRTAGEKTLGEVQMLQDGAFRGFVHKAEQFEIDLLEPLITDMIEIGGEYFSEAMTASVETDEGIRYINITQDDLRSNGKLVPYGARRFARDLQQMNMINQLANGNMMQVIAPHVNTGNLAKTLERLGGFERYEFIEKFAALDEQAEMQMKQNAVEQAQQGQMMNPSLGEVEMEAALGATQDTSVPE
ncbi:coil containing protein [Vibrio phage 275E43-1]|nr:coil containing protein [Vibrio phage 275E43-1]